MLTLGPFRFRHLSSFLCRHCVFPLCPSSEWWTIGMNSNVRIGIDLMSALECWTIGMNLDVGTRMCSNVGIGMHPMSKSEWWTIRMNSDVSIRMSSDVIIGMVDHQNEL